jgi:hypothetical protein
MTATTQAPTVTMRSIRRVATLVLICGLTVASAASAATREQAVTKARKAANHYTTAHYAIGFAGADGWRMWSARCTTSGAGWRCTARMSNGQCAGKLKLTHTLTPFGHRLTCHE